MEIYCYIRYQEWKKKKIQFDIESIWTLKRVNLKSAYQTDKYISAQENMLIFRLR